MSYVDANTSELQGAGSAFILEPDNHDIHPDDEWSTHPAIENVNLDGHKIENLANPTASTDAVNKTHLDSNFYNQSTADSRYLKTDGTNSMDDNLNMDSNKITNLTDPTSAQEGASKNYVDTNYYDQCTSDSRYLRTDGSNAMSNNLDAGDNKLINVNDPTNSKDAVNLQYLNSNNSGFEVKQVTDVQSSTLNQNGAISHSKQVSGLSNRQYLCQIQVTVWGDFTSNYTLLQFLLQDDGFTDQYDPAKQARQSNGGTASRFQLVNGGEIGREDDETSVYTFTLLTNTTTQITFNTDVIDNGGLGSSSTVYTRLRAFIPPASVF